MAKIAYAVQSGNQVKVYNEHNACVFSHTGELAGYTQNTVTIEKNDRTYVYNNCSALMRIH